MGANHFSAHPVLRSNGIIGFRPDWTSVWCFTNKNGKHSHQRKTLYTSLKQNKPRGSNELLTENVQNIRKLKPKTCRTGF